MLLFRSYFHHFIFKLTDSFFCFRYSVIDSFKSIFNFSNCVVCLGIVFNSSISLLIDSCIFSNLFSRFFFFFFFYHVYYHYSEFLFRYFASFLFIYLDFWVCSLFLHLCSISLPFHYFFFNLFCLRSPFPRLQGWILSSFWFLLS